jgi:diguanylate cyclase (GGDEF)-like protein
MPTPRPTHRIASASPRRWLEAPDPTLIEFASGGARRLALVRVGIFVFLFATSVASLVSTDDPLVPYTTPAVGIGLLIAIGAAWRVHAKDASPGLAFVMVTLDVSLISAILVGFAISGNPYVAAHSMVVWELYLFAIVAACLHFDLRVVLFAGVMAAAQWAGVLSWVSAHWPLPAQVAVDPRHVALVQTLRFGLIGTFTLGAGLLVLRSAHMLRLSGMDALTGLANRALLDQRLVEEVAAARRWGRPLSVAFLDIDRFKVFNDRWGHRAGDEALRATARALIAESRESDVIARWGGEEFVLVLPDSLGKDAAMAIERIRGRLGVTPIPGVSPEARVTLSAGIAEFPADGDEAGLLERVADRRLMVAKRRGRDCVVAYD